MTCTLCRRPLTTQEVAAYGSRCEMCWVDAEHSPLLSAARLYGGYEFSPDDLERACGSVRYAVNPRRRGPK